MSMPTERRRTLKSDLNALLVEGIPVLRAALGLEPSKLLLEQDDAHDRRVDHALPQRLDRLPADREVVGEVEVGEQLVDPSTLVVGGRLDRVSHGDSPSVRATRPESASAGPRTVGVPADAPRTPSRRVGGLAEFFDGAREGHEDAAPVAGPRHARTAPDVVERTMTALAVVSLALFSALIAGIFAGWWLA